MDGRWGRGNIPKPGCKEIQFVSFLKTRCCQVSCPHSALYTCPRAIRRENLADVKRFLDEGGDIETIGGRFHSTLLTEACRFRVAKVTNLLLERGAAANVSGGGFWTPLHYACAANSTAGAAGARLVETLVKNHAEVDATDFQGRTPLHIACARGSSAVVLALLESGKHGAQNAGGGSHQCTKSRL